MSYFKKLDITIFSQGTGSHRQKDKLREVHEPTFPPRPREYPTSKSKITSLSLGVPSRSQELSYTDGEIIFL